MSTTRIIVISLPRARSESGLIEPGGVHTMKMNRWNLYQPVTVASTDACRQGDVLAAQEKSFLLFTARVFAAQTARNRGRGTRTARSESIDPAGNGFQGRRPVACTRLDSAGCCRCGPVVGAVDVGAERRGAGLSPVCSGNAASTDLCVAVAARDRLPRMRIDP